MASGDTAQEQLDDQFRSLLEGLRTTLPGVQVLFAFLLSLPLLPAFDDLSTLGEWAYGVAFFASAISSVLLIAPSVHQRVRAPISGIRRNHADHVDAAVRLAIVGTVTFVIALMAATLLISLVILPTFGLAVAATAAIGVLVGWSWFYMPLFKFR